MTLSETAEALAEMMARKRIVRMTAEYERPRGGGFLPMSIELHPSAFVAKSQDATKDFPAGEPDPDFLFASSLPVTPLETAATMPEPPGEAAPKP